MENFDNEIWKPARYIFKNGTVVDFSEYYEVSNKNRVRSLDTYLNGGYDSKRLHKGKIKNLYIKEGDYIRLQLHMEGKTYYVNLHRLVASSFPEICGEWFEGAECNHKSECKTDCSPENLEWCTTVYNHNYGTAKERMINTLSTPIIQYDLNGEYIREWHSSLEVERELGYAHTSINNVCKKKKRYKTAYGFKWEYKQ